MKPTSLTTPNPAMAASTQASELLQVRRPFALSVSGLPRPRRTGSNSQSNGRPDTELM